MPDPYFLGEYQRKAALGDAFGQSGRSSQLDPLEYLHVLREVLGLLELERSHALLDVGCANGLFEIPMSSLCRSILAVEPVEGLAAHARKNLAGIANVEVKAGHGASVPAPDASFDRVLMMEVIQLIAPQELPAVFRELRRVARAGARLVFGSVPDRKHRERFLGPYLEGVRKAGHLSAAQKVEIVERNEKASWYNAAELAEQWQALGCRAAVRSPSAGFPAGDHRFHLIVTAGG